MPTSPLRRVVDHLRRVAYLQAGATLKDEDLLKAFIVSRDDAAFETLVRRHGPMVMGVCRRVLRDSHHAEDAFQATFMVLIRKAASLSRRERLVKWLYGVANRTALQAKKQAARRRAKERDAMSQPKTGRDDGTDEILAHLDEELSRLPDKYRVPIILCDLEGKTRKAAAEQLSVPEGTLSTWLMRGRAALAKRMKRHGTALSGSALAATLSQKALGAVPPSLVAATVKAGSMLAAGKTVAGTIPVAVATLTEGVVKTMLLGKLKILAVAVVATVLAVIVGDMTLRHRARASVLADANARPGRDDAAASAAPGPNGKTSAAASEDKTIKLHATLTGHSDGVMSIAFSPDGKALASGSYDQTIKLWDAATGKEKAALRGHYLQRFTQMLRSFSVNSVAYSPDGKVLASGSSDHTIKLWDTLTGNETTTLTGHDDEVHAVAFSPDGRTLATASEDEVIKLWNVASGKEEVTFDERFAGPLRVWSLAFSPDGNTLATAHHYPVIKLWDVATAKAITTLKGHTSIVAAVACSPDGKTLASASYDKTIKLWDMASGKETATLQGHAGDVNCVAFSPDGKTLASGGSDKTIKLWEVATGKELATIAAHRGRVNSVAFSPDGNTLASASLDKTIKLWDIQVREAVRPKEADAPGEAKDDTTPSTTRAEKRQRFFSLPNVRFNGDTISSDYVFDENPERGLFGGAGSRERWDISVSPATKVTIDGKETRFAELKALVANPNPDVPDNGEVVIVRCELELTAVSEDSEHDVSKLSKGRALRLDARGQQVNALLQGVNVGESTFKAKLSGLWADEPFRAGLDELTDAEPVDVHVAKDAALSVDGKPAKLADLKPNMRVFLQKAARKNVALSIAAYGVRVHGDVTAVDQEKNTIRIHIPRLQLASGAVPVAKDSKILVGGVPAKLSDLRPGMHVTLQMSAAREESLVVGITAEKAKKE